MLRKFPKKKMNILVIALIIVIIIISLVVIGINFLSNNSISTGLIEGKLKKCPNKPNCINTEYHEDISHYVTPLDYPLSKSKLIILLSKETIIEMGGEIVFEEKNYLAAKFTSAFFRFVDDFEVRCCDELNQLHIRSASRIGYSDFGVNKHRVERFSIKFATKINK